MHAVLFGFGAGAIAGPSIVADAVGCDHRSGAIGAEMAMNKHRLILRIVQDGQHLIDLIIAWRADALERDVEIPEPEAFSFVLFRLRLTGVIAQIDDRPHAHPAEQFQTAWFRLGAAIELRVDLMKVW